MPDALAFAGMIQSLQAMANIAKALIGLHDERVVNERVVELTGEILAALAAQAEQVVLLEHVRDLEKHLAELNAWNADKEKYGLRQIRPGVYAYTLKETTNVLEKSLMLCANCYEQRHKSILQEEIRDPGRCRVLVCHLCGADLYVEGERRPEHSSAARKSRRT